MDMIREKAKKIFYNFICLLICTSLIGFTHAANDPTDSQQIAIKRIENFLDHFRRTGDYTSKLGELHQAEKDLVDSYDAFIHGGKISSAALSQIKIGDIQRMQNNWQKAKTHYQQAYDLAKKADHKEYQARARLNQAKTEQFALDETKRKTSAKDSSGTLVKLLRLDYSGARVYAQEAVQLANELNNPGLLFDALEVQGAVLISSGDLNAASGILNQAISAAKTSGDETNILYAFLNKADLNREQAFKCISTGNYSIYCPDNDTTSWCGVRPWPYPDIYLSCYKAHDEALSDYEKSLRMAKKLAFKGLEQLIEEQVAGLERQQCMVQVNECLNKEGAKITPRIHSGKLSEQQIPEELIRVKRECKLVCVDKLPEAMINPFFQ